jgi:hypothetical protein
MISARLSVEDGQYWVTDGNPAAGLALPDPGGDNGLVAVAAGLAMVVTGTQFGNVGLIVATGDSDPGLNLGGWDDVVEVSLTSGQGGQGLGITSGGLGPDSLQALTAGGTGTYRIRVHARGRDAGADHDAVTGNPVEEHLLQIWPAPAAAALIHAATDRFGQAFRTGTAPGSDPRYPSGEHIELNVGQAIAQTDRARAALEGIDVHASGCRFKFRVVVDVSGLTPRQEKRARRAVNGHAGAAMPDSADSSRLRVTAHFGDGRGVDSGARPDPIPSAGPAISASYSSNYPLVGTQVAEESFWSWPLPPAEPFTLTLEWPAVGIPAAAAIVDGAAIIVAARSLPRA